MTAVRPLAAVYLRISLDQTGEDLAIDRQREDCMRILTDRGWDLYGGEPYVDRVSASDRRKVRAGYNQLVEDARAGKFDRVVCWNLDRLTRQPRQLEDWIDLAQEHAVTLVTATGEADLSNDDGQLFARVKASVARAEIGAKSRRQAAAARQRAKRGKPPLGPRLTGYMPDGAVVPEEATVVQTVFDRFSRGDSLRSIATALTANGVPTRSGRPWSPSSVTAMLRNPRYAGLAVYQGKLTGGHGTWEPLVSEDRWRVVQAVLDDPRRKTNRMGTDRKHLGSGLYICGECDGPVQSWSGDRYRCVRCSLARSAAPIDRLVLELVAARLRRPDLTSLLATPANEEAIASLQDRAAMLRARLARVNAEYDNGIIDGLRHRAASAVATAELDEVERERLGLVGTSATAHLLQAPDPGTQFLAETLMVQRRVIDALIQIRLRRQPRGSRTFDPSSVEPRWRGAESPLRPRLRVVSGEQAD